MAPRRPRLKNHTFCNNEVEDTRNLEVRAIRLEEHMSCAMRSWRNIKIYYVYRVIDCKILSWR